MKKSLTVTSFVTAVCFSGLSQAALVTNSDMGSFFSNPGLKSTYDFEPISGFPTPPAGGFAFIGYFGPVSFDATTYKPSAGTTTSGKYAMTGWDDTFSTATLDFSGIQGQRVIGFGFYGLDLTVDEVIRVNVEFAAAGTQIFDVSLANINNPLTPSYFGAYDDADSILSLEIFGTDSTGATRAWAIDDLTLVTAPVPVPASLWLLGSGIAGLISVARRKKSA